jgi:hypothetical protein
MRDNGTLACSATMKASSGHLEETGSSACNEAPEKVCLLPAKLGRTAAAPSGRACRGPRFAAGGLDRPSASRTPVNRLANFAGRMPPEPVLRAASGIAATTRPKGEVQSHPRAHETGMLA